MAAWLSHTLFMLSAVGGVAAAVMVVTRRNPIYSALYLILFFGTMALDFLLLDAAFLAFMQILVYAGAIMVLYMFVIMIINPRADDLPEEGTVADRSIAFAVALVLFVLLEAAIARSDKFATLPAVPYLPPVPLGHGEIAAFGRELFTQHLLVFELASVLITVAIVGAVHLSLRARRKPARENAPEPGTRGTPREPGQGLPEEEQSGPRKEALHV